MHRLGSVYGYLWWSGSHGPVVNSSTLYLLNHCCEFSYSPDSTESVYDSLVKSSDGLGSLKQVHSALTTTNLIARSPHLVAQIIIKYANFGDANSARSLFHFIDSYGGGKGKPSSFLWNTMIRAYANSGHCFETLDLYSLMRRRGISPNNYTFPFVFKACASNSLIPHGRVAHGDAVKTGFAWDLYVDAALVDMYGACGQLADGRKLLDEMPVKDLVCWTAMITAYEQAEKPEQALLLFQTLQNEGLLPDAISIVSVASAVAQLGDDKRARSVHAYALRNSFLEKVFVCNAVLTMYTRCEDIEKARSVFNSMHERDVISWNAMLSGYTQNGLASEALVLFDEMLDSDCEPTPVTALIMVTACAYLGSNHLGRRFHDLIVDSEMEIDTNLWNALMDMYAKSGQLETALEIFNGLHPRQRNVSSWNVLISGYGMHGYGKEAVELFTKMQAEGVEPDHITFTCLLAACSHTGLVDEGRKYFADMAKFSVTADANHYACMVDMLGRAGHLEEAYDLIKQMPSAPHDGVWGALLLACKIHGNMELGKTAAKNLFQLEPDRTGYYVLMSNIYAASNKWQEASKLRTDMKDKGLQKPAAFSMIEYNKEILGFHTADRENPYRQEAYTKVQSLAVEMKMAGYIPDLSCALHDVEDEDKEHILNYHSEKLAVAFGILKINPGMAIQVTKNLRVCNDCHSAFKFISSIYKRKILVRDVNRFHHFEGGACSCKDYW